MELKLFGKSLFSFKKSKGQQLFEMAMESPQKSGSKYIPDFKEVGSNSGSLSDWAISESVAINLTSLPKKGKKKIVKKTAPKKKMVTPKGVYEMKLLNDDSFKINTNAEYVDKLLEDFKDKLNMISSEEYDMRRGVEEIGSMVLRLENRKKYSEHKEVFEEFPYTTTTRINEVVKNHDNLQLGKIAQFLADMPKEATEAMKKYDTACTSLCGKKAVFYIIADKKDFKKTESRRDPILLAQSPFGHFWQILGAWDDEMLFLEEL